MSLETLTVAELIAELQSYDPDTPVVACSNYGDRSGTMQAVAINELNDNVYLTDTAYSDTGYKVVEEGDEDDGDQQVLVLNYDLL